MLMRFRKSKSANAAVIFALIGVPLMASVGVTMDYSRASRVRDHLQETLDAALLMGIANPAGSRGAASSNFFSKTWPAPDGVAAVTSFTETSASVLTGTASANVPTYLAKLIGVSTIAVSVNGQAQTGAPAPPCILLLDPSASNAILVNSGANVQAPNCEIHVKSTGSPAAIFNSNSTVTAKNICIQGTYIISNGGSHNNTNIGCATAGDPYAATLPAPASTTCQYGNLNFNGGNVAMTPGVYCGWINFNSAPNVTFAPGLYVIQGGGWNVDGGTWSVAGVTFYFTDTSTLQFNSAVNATLSAPTSGAWTNFLFAEAPGLAKSNFILDDSNGQNFTGIVYLPSRNATINSTSSVSAEQAGFVFNTLIFNNAVWNISGAGAPGASSGVSPKLTQ